MRLLVLLVLIALNLGGFAQTKADFEKYVKTDPLSGKIQIRVNDTLWSPGKQLPPVCVIKLLWMPVDTTQPFQYQLGSVFLMLGTESGINRKIPLGQSNKSKIPFVEYSLNVPKLVPDSTMTIASIQAGLVFQIAENGRARRMLLGRKNLVTDFKFAQSTKNPK